MSLPFFSRTLWCTGVSRIEQLQRTPVSPGRHGNAVDVEPIRIVDVADSHNVLRRIDARKSGLKCIVLDFNSNADLAMILEQVST